MVRNGMGLGGLKTSREQRQQQAMNDRKFWLPRLLLTRLTTLWSQRAETCLGSFNLTPFLRASSHFNGKKTTKSQINNSTLRCQRENAATLVGLKKRG